MSEPNRETIAQLKDELDKYKALHPYFEDADQMLKLRDLHNITALDGTFASVSHGPDPATNLRAFIDRYIEQGEELKSARAMLKRVTTAESVDDLFSAKTECLMWLDDHPEVETGRK